MDSKNEIILSVVLPIYNVENYLRQAMKSILAFQNQNEIEIILVDDGSTDSSRLIVDEYLKNGANIKVFHKTNGGLSDARNCGLYHAVGQYVFFMDADDLLEDKAIDVILSSLKNDNLDVLLFDAIMIDDTGKKIKSNKNKYYTHTGVNPDKLYTGVGIINTQLEINNDYATTVWLGVYRRNLLLREALWFEKGLLHEDEMWTQKVLINAKIVKYMEQPLYQYRIRTNSIMNDSKKKYSVNLASLIYIYNTLPDYIDWKVSDIQNRQKIKANISKRYLHALYRFDLRKYPENIVLIDRWKIFKNSRGSVDRIRSIILLISVRLYCMLMRLSKKR